MRTLITTTILISASALATEPKIHRDIAYTSPADASRRLDVYAPTDGEGHPVLVWLHGGGWRHVERWR